MNQGHRTGVIPRIFLLFCLLAALPNLSPTTLHAENLGLDKEVLKGQLTDLAIEQIFSGLPNMPEARLKDATYFNELLRGMEPFGVKLDKTNFTETALNIYNTYKEEYEKEQDPVKAKQKVKDLLKGDVRTLIFQSLDKGSQEVLTDLQGLYGDAEGELNKVLKLNDEMEKDPDADYAKLMKDFGIKGEYLEKFEKLEGNFNAAYEKYGDYYNASKIIYTGMTGHSGDKIEALFELGATFGRKIPVLGKFVELYFKVAQEMLKATGRLGKLLQERQQGCLGVGTVGWIQTISSATNDRNVAFSEQFPHVVACPANEAMKFYRDIYEQVGSMEQLYFWTDSGFVEGNPSHGGINAVKAFRSWLRSNSQVDKANDLQFIAKSYNIPPGFPEKQRQLEEMIEDVNRVISSLRQALGSCTSDVEFVGFLLDRGGLQRVVDTSDGTVEYDSYLRGGLSFPDIFDKVIEDRYIKETVIFHKACVDAQKKLREIVVAQIKGAVYAKKGGVPEPTFGVTIKADPIDRVVEKCSQLSTDRNGSFEILVVHDKSDSFSMNLQADYGTNASDTVSIPISGDKKSYSVKLSIKGECKAGEVLNEKHMCVPVSADNEQAKSTLVTAKELAAKGSYNEATTMAEEALKLDPNNHQIHQLIKKWTAQKQTEQARRENERREQAERKRKEAEQRAREQAEIDRRASALKAAQEKKIQEGQKLKENTQQVKKTATKPKSFTQLSEEEKKDFLDCVCGCGSSFYNTGYHPEPTESSYSPSCDDLANGPCLGGGYGCARSKMPTGGECVTNCYAQYNVIPDSNTTNILIAENKKHQKPLKVTLAPDAKPIKAQHGTTVSLTATVEGGQPGYTYSWSGQGDAKDNTYTFINTREPGTFAVAVTVNDSDGGSATAATSIVVEALTVTIEKISPAGNTVPVGGQASFKATVVGGTDVNYLWQPHPEVEFDPFEKSATTTATFRNPESVGVWVEVLVKDGAVMRSAGRSNVITLQVANPQWAMEFIPASPRVGQPVKAKISPTGPQAAAINTAEMNFRWQLPANAKQTGTSQDDREITFVLHDTKPASISCTAATKRKNENLGGRGKTITAQEYAVKVSGPRGRQEFQIWKCETQLGGAPECGMKKVENQFAAGNEILFGATVEPLPEKPVSYNWTASPDGCSIASPFSREIGMTCSSTGSYTVTVIAKSDGLAIGSASASVSVTISQNDINNSNKSKEAYEKLQKAKELVGQGKLDEGIVLIDEALRLDPKLTEAAALGQKWKSEKQDIVKHVERIKNLLPADDIAQAEQELAAAQKLHPKYAPVVEVEKILNEAKKISAEKKIREQATTTTGGDPSKLSMLNRILDNRNKNSGISQPETTPRIAAIKKENTGALGSPEKNPNDSAPRGGCSEETIVLHHNYQGVCSYTNSTSFTLVKATNITRIGIRFDTGVGGKTLSATLSRSNGYKIAVGTIARGDCQGGWCEAIWNLDQVLKTGTYTLTADSTSICADPSGQTTLALYGCSYSQENVNGRQGPKPENAPAPPPAPSAPPVTRVTPSPKADVQNLDEAIAKLERAIANFNSKTAEIEARSKTLKGAGNIAAANNEIKEAKKFLPAANAELNRLKALKQSNEKGQAASGNFGSWEYVGIGDCPGNDIAGGAAGSVPNPQVCDSQHAGLAAVCWDGTTPRVMSPPGCTIKRVRAENCTGGVNPGRMYRCAFQTGSQ